MQTTIARPLAARECIGLGAVTLLPGPARVTEPRNVGGIRCRIIWTPDGGKYIASARAFREARR